MQLTADQQLRKELLLYSLEKQPEMEAAIAMAVRMERFILEGLEGCADAPAPPVPDGLRVPDGDEAAGNDKAPGSAATEAVPGRFGSGGTKRRWSDADDAKLKDLWDSASSLEEIAETLERTVPSLYSRARALGLAKRVHHYQENSATQRHAGDEGQNGSAGNGAGAPVCSTGQCAVSDERHASDTSVRRSEVTLDRYRPKGRRSSQNQRARNGGAISAHSGLAAAKPSRHPVEDLSIDPVIQFLRSRDYSVVRVGDGRFKLDGRRVLSVEELREKANQVRKTLGQPPFPSLGTESVS